MISEVENPKDSKKNAKILRVVPGDQNWEKNMKVWDFVEGNERELGDWLKKLRHCECKLISRVEKERQTERKKKARERDNVVGVCIL